MRLFSRDTKNSEETPIERLVSPFIHFARREAAGGVLLMLCALAALVWANSPWADSYTDLWEKHLSFGFSDFLLDETLHFWINDALMVVFFFVVGLEIKRELRVGELSSPRRAALPVVAAVGGMVVPAVFYLAFNLGTDGERGWGIPMATDIAFSLGILAILGQRVPLALKVFLTAFAIADDLGAVAIIAVFYSADISWINLVVGFGLLGIIGVAGRLYVRHPLVYTLLGIAVWLAFLKSGIHVTVAGVLVAALIPCRARIDPDKFVSRSRALLDRFTTAGVVSVASRGCPTSIEQRAVLAQLETVAKEAESPLQRIEENLHPWVIFVVIPLFALANAGVVLDSGLADAVSDRITLGVLFGLVVGKQLGITLFAWVAIKTGLVHMPPSLSWRHIYGVAWLGGIGFTMSIFIADLAFGGAQELASAKIGSLVASIVCGVVGWLILRGIKFSWSSRVYGWDAARRLFDDRPLRGESR